MASGTEQLIADFEEVQSTLELYPSINIIQVEGQPPDSYEIEYLLKGYVRNADGSIRQGSQHRIRISLPFGYPHFPPTVKPLSPVFHPDIDPDAVRITTYWQKSPSLSDLIIHIGEMICGNIYNLEDPFNQEAADWYAEHIDDLPIDTLQVADIESADDHLDTLNDDSFDLLGLEDEEFAEEAQDAEQQLELIRLRIEQKEMVAAGQLLAEIPDSTPVHDRDEIEHVISAALRESDKLLQQARQLEDKGKVDKALEVVERVDEIATDTPGLEDMRLRLQQAQVMAETFSGATHIPEASTPSSQSESIPAPGDNKQTKQKKRADVKSGIPKLGIAGLPIKPILATALTLIVAAGGTIFYFKDRNSLNQAETGWQQARNHMQKNQFKDAEKSAQTALASLNKVLILRSKKKELQTDISGLLNSTLFKKGLQGQVQYNDQYMPTETVAKLQKFEELTVEAENLIKAGKISEAVTAYGTARKFAQQNGLQSQAQYISQTINNLRFEETMASARKAENAKEWQNAAAIYQRALEISKTLSDAEGTGDISKKLAAATFRHELDLSRATFTEAQWQQTIEMLEDAKKLLNENPDTVSAGERKELDQLLADAHLYQILSLARQAYENREWDTAVKKYQKSIDLLKDKQDIFAGSHDNAVAKIEKTMLMIKIAHEQSGATAAEQKNDLKTALTHYKAIEELITSSGFSEESDIVAIGKIARSQIRGQAAQLAMENKINWLKKNFENIFYDAYPSSRSSQLSRPKVTFIKEENGKQIFHMTCVEQSQGSSFRLEVKYQYNLSNTKWSIYYDQ